VLYQAASAQRREQAMYAALRQLERAAELTHAPRFRTLVQVKQHIDRFFHGGSAVFHVPEQLDAYSTGRFKDRVCADLTPG
jgi:hypothetical protein